MTVLTSIRGHPRLCAIRCIILFLYDGAVCEGLCHHEKVHKWLSDEALETADERLKQYEKGNRGWNPSFLKPEDAALRTLWGKATEYYLMTRRQ
jgi:hypothetical protein